MKVGDAVHYTAPNGNLYDGVIVGRWTVHHHCYGPHPVIQNAVLVPGHVFGEDYGDWSGKTIVVADEFLTPSEVNRVGQ